MRDIELLQKALGLLPPWEVQSSEFDPDRKRLDIPLAFPRGSTFSCPVRGREGLKVHDTVNKTWRHLNFFQHEAYLTAKVPRVRCEHCGATRLIEVPWARPGIGFTLLFEAYIMTLAKAMPVNTIAQLKRWFFRATHSRLQPIIDAAYTNKRHWNGVFQWFKSSLNNGILEGINSLIQAAKACARGYRTPKNLIAMIYLIGGKLDFNLPT